MSGTPPSVMARCGPQLRSPTGGNFAAAAKARASAGVLIIGAMMPSAPKSSARETSAKSPTGTRTIGAAPPCRTAAMPVRSELTSHRPCWPSSVTAGNPSRPTVSATSGYGRLHQPLNTVSPARRRRARVKAAMVMIGNLPKLLALSSLLALVSLLISLGRGAAARLFSRLDVGDRLFHQLGHGPADLVIGLGDALGVEILANLARDIVSAGCNVAHHQ